MLCFSPLRHPAERRCWKIIVFLTFLISGDLEKKETVKFSVKIQKPSRQIRNNRICYEDGTYWEKSFMHIEAIQDRIGSLKQMKTKQNNQCNTLFAEMKDRFIMNKSK